MSRHLGPAATRALMLVTVVVWVGFDILSAALGPPGSTESWQIYDAGRRYEAVPFAVGLLCGHLFLGMPGVATGPSPGP